MSYLKDYPVENPGIDLPNAKRRALVNLFRAAHYACLFKYRQSYYVRTDMPLYCILKRYYPGLSKLEGEIGHIIYLGSIVEFFEGPEAFEDPESEQR